MNRILVGRKYVPKSKHIGEWKSALRLVESRNKDILETYSNGNYSYHVSRLYENPVEGDIRIQLAKQDSPEFPHRLIVDFQKDHFDYFIEFEPECMSAAILWKLKWR